MNVSRRRFLAGGATLVLAGVTNARAAAPNVNVTNVTAPEPPALARDARGGAPRTAGLPGNADLGL